MVVSHSFDGAATFAALLFRYLDLQSPLMRIVIMMRVGRFRRVQLRVPRKMRAPRHARHNECASNQEGEKPAEHAEGASVKRRTSQLLKPLRLDASALVHLC